VGNGGWNYNNVEQSQIHLNNGAGNFSVFEGSGAGKMATTLAITAVVAFAGGVCQLERCFPESPPVSALPPRLSRC
tara:strand:- start:117 stop:344 length:228 start_codon:yes stop_codon:yes gene_type:complete